jgi:hypothetical protein
MHACRLKTEKKPGRVPIGSGAGLRLDWMGLLGRKEGSWWERNRTVERYLPTVWGVVGHGVSLGHMILLQTFHAERVMPWSQSDRMQYEEIKNSC